MISHALSIIANELEQHLISVYTPSDTSPKVSLGNIANGVGGDSGIAKDIINFSLVNIKEEKSLKNLPHYVRNEAALTARYENPPVFLNFQILITATHAGYTNALLALSRVIRFFQFKNVFTQDSVAPLSLSKNQPLNELDQLSQFKLIFDLYSPTMEEINHLWGTLGGKQYPFVLYTMRMLDLQFKATQSESKLITEIVSNFYLKNSVTNS